MSEWKALLHLREENVNVPVLMINEKTNPLDLDDIFKASVRWLDCLKSCKFAEKRFITSKITAIVEKGP